MKTKFNAELVPAYTPGSVGVRGCQGIPKDHFHFMDPKVLLGCTHAKNTLLVFTICGITTYPEGAGYVSLKWICAVHAVDESPTVRTTS